MCKTSVKADEKWREGGARAGICFQERRAFTGPEPHRELPPWSIWCPACTALTGLRGLGGHPDAVAFSLLSAHSLTHTFTLTHTHAHAHAWHTQTCTCIFTHLYATAVRWPVSQTSQTLCCQCCSQAFLQILKCNLIGFHGPWNFSTHKPSEVSVTVKIEMIKTGFKKKQ